MKSSESAGEKKCLNCGTLLAGPYCSHCGQKDVDLKEPFWKVFSEFVSDYWHFDSKFFRTLSPLLFKPGYLTLEFNAGRRARYVNPIRLYFFISVVFFLTYFSLASDSGFQEKADDQKSDSLIGKLSTLDANQVDSLRNLAEKNQVVIQIGNTNRALPKTLKAYDDSVRNLPASQRPAWYLQLVDKQNIKFREFGKDAVYRQMIDTAKHNLPKVMFLLLPVFALLLKGVYVRKKIYFTDHAVFTLHMHAFAFLVLLAGIPLAAIFHTDLQGILMLVILFYLYKAMRKVYQQSRVKTTLKLIFITIIYTTIFGLAMVMNMVYSLVSV